MSTIYCIGRNYAEHAAELGNAVPTTPIVFLKSQGALRRVDEDGLAYPTETFHHEAELVLRVGRAADLGATPGWEIIDEVALGLDLTRRGVQSELKAKGLPWTAAKSFAGAAVISAFVPRSAFPDPDQIEFTLSVGGELRQHGNTRDMIFKVPALLAHLASSTPLRIGDLIYTGTPSGVAGIRKGDPFVLAFPALALEFKGTL